MFESIKQSLLSNDKKSNGNFRDFLKLEAGNTYLVRFLPNVKDAAKTFFHYYHYGWNSVATGQYVDVISPKTWGDPDPVEAERIKLYRNKSDNRAISLAKLLNTKEKWLVNVYVVDDPVNPENNGTVKVFRYGQQIDKVVKAAVQGEDSAEFGPAIFDLSENGCNLRIKVESTKEGTRSFVNYSSSRFLRPSAIPNMTPEKIKEVLDGVHELEVYFNRKAPAEMKEMLAIHLYGKEDDATNFDTTKLENQVKVQQLTEMLKPEVKAEAAAKVTPPATPDVVAPAPVETNTATAAVQSDDDKIKTLLAGL